MSSMAYIEEVLARPALERVTVRYFNRNGAWCSDLNEDALGGADVIVRSKGRRPSEGWSDTEFNLRRAEGQSNYGLMSSISALLCMLEAMHGQGARDRSKALSALLDDK